MDSQNVPNERTRVFDKNGYPIAEFSTSVERSWALGTEGRALFNFPSIKTDIVNERVLQFGNWILCESDSLPPWVGVIDLPREWSPRIVAVHAYSPERVFSWRRGLLEEKINAPAGKIFQKLLEILNSAEPTIIRNGDIWTGGISREETLNPKTIDDDLSRISNRSGEEYTWRPYIDSSGRLLIYADWQPVIGEETPLLLQEGRDGGNTEVSNNYFVEDGDIINDLFGYGDGETWTSKQMVTVKNADSIARYGLRQSSENFSGVTSATTIKNNAMTKLNEKKQPERSFHLNALNVGETFKFIRVGNIATLRFQSAGFMNGSTGYETKVRILGMAYDPATEKNKIELVVKEVI